MEGQTIRLGSFNKISSIEELAASRFPKKIFIFEVGRAVYWPKENPSGRMHFLVDEGQRIAEYSMPVEELSAKDGVIICRHLSNYQPRYSYGPSHDNKNWHVLTGKNFVIQNRVLMEAEKEDEE